MAVIVMKKIIILVLVLLMMFPFAACGDIPSEKETTPVETEAPPETTAKPEPTETPGENEEPKETTSFASGDKGTGEAFISNGLFSVTIPEGLDYEIYTWYTAEDNEKFGTYEIDIAEKGASSVVRLTVTTQRMVDSLESAAKECIRMNDFSGAKTATIGADITINGVTYKTVTITGDESYDETNMYYATFYYTNADGDNDVYVEISSTEAGPFTNLSMENPLVQKMIESLKFYQ